MEPELQDLPYDERRLVVVVKPEAVRETKNDSSQSGLEVAIGAALSFALSIGIAGTIGLVGLPLARAVLDFRKQARAGDFHGDLRVISPIEARQFSFPVGHPRKKVVYVGHPLDPAVYQPFANFHSFLFEHKVAEAQRLIRALGAETISIVRIAGWGQTTGLHVDVPVHGTNVGASGDSRTNAEAYIETKMTLNPTKQPHIPNGLVWFPHEPLWREVAEARLESGLTSFEIEVKSSDDYGVNLGLKAMVQKSGLDIGGEFVKHETTVWRLKGTFARL